MRKNERMERTLAEKWVRGRMLSFLDKNAPAGLNAEVLWELLDLANHSITDAELLRHLAYLEGKGYLTVSRTERGDDLGRVFLGITPAGMDLVSGYTSDVGVEV